MAWKNRLSDKMARPFFYLVVEGIPFVFMSSKDTGGYWAAPRCARHTTDIPAYTVLYDCLQVDQGIRSMSWNIDEKAGIVEPGQMTLRLTDIRGQLRSLFATRLSGANTTRVTDHLTWTADAVTGDDRYQLDVESTAGFDGTADIIYVGRETCYYTDLAATRFGDDPEDAADFKRGCYAWHWHGSDDLDRWHLDYRHEYADADIFVAETVSDNPRTWIGRRAVLCMNYFREQPGVNVPFDATFRGDHEVEVFGGVLAANPANTGGDDWEIRLAPYTALLDTSIGANAADGTIGFPDQPYVYVGAQARPVQIIDAAVFDSTGGTTTHFVGTSTAENSDYIHVRDTAAATLNDIIADELLPFRTFLGYMAQGLQYALQNGPGLFSNWPDFERVRMWLDDDYHVRAEIEWDHAADTRYTFYLTVKLSRSIIKSDVATAGRMTTRGGEFGGVVNSTGILEFDPSPHQSLFYGHDQNSHLPIDLSEQSRLFGRDFRDDTGYALLGGKEVIRYSGTTTAGVASGYQILEVERRQDLGTGSQFNEVTLMLDEGRVKVQDALGIVDAQIWDSFLMMACSTGGGSRHTDYDDDFFGDRWGAAIDPSVFDAPSFVALNEREGDLARRTLAVTKPTNLKSWISQECSFAQAVVTQRTCEDGRVRVGVYPIDDPAQSEAIGNKMSTLHGTVNHGALRPVNTVHVKTGWHAGEAKHKGDDVHVRHVGSIMSAGQEFDLDLKIPGLVWPDGTAVGSGTFIATRIMARWLEPGQVVALKYDNRGVLFRPGQTVQITVPNIATDEGGVGYTARPAVVLGVEWTPYDPGKTYHSMVTVRVPPEQQISTWCPCGKVTAKGGNTVTLAANTFSEATDVNPWDEYPTTDAVWFQAGSVQIWEEGDWAGREHFGIVSRAANIITLDGPLVMAVGANTFMTYDDYDDGDTIANQKVFVYVGDNATPSALGAADDPAFRYG